jgi:hypothetical protein
MARRPAPPGASRLAGAVLLWVGTEDAGGPPSGAVPVPDLPAYAASPHQSNISTQYLLCICFALVQTLLQIQNPQITPLQLLLQ